MSNVITKSKSEELVEALLNSGAMKLVENQILVGKAIIKYMCKGDIFYLDVLTTAPECRKQGHSKKAMNILCDYAKQFDVTIELICGKVNKINPNVRMNVRMKGIDFASFNGTLTTDAIPVKDLPKFYSKFGFIKDGKINNKVKMKFN
ncbi:GNAT family N-acetyltransferase [Psychroserpens mesophilus]|uniref:GNAT family N-acetyltransferase n=1 Tax=Psychroserpens mesophilus TaxID=325473 RepID=UPI003D660621